MLYLMNERHKTPGGRYSVLYDEMAKQTHLLIAGRTGSGKSCVVNGIIHSQLCRKTCRDEQLILLDPKRVELSQWKNTPHCLFYSCDPMERIQALSCAVRIIEQRYEDMDSRGLKKYDGGQVHVIIDELADIMTTQKNEALPLIQRIAQIGRAAGVHLIACTQCPTASILSTPLKCNFDSILGLRTRSPQDSRNVIGIKGCERLPQNGQGYFITPTKEGIVDLPLIPDSEVKRVADYWSNRINYVAI